MNVLLKNGSAYRCFCTDHRLDLLKREALRLREVPKYDNKCRHLSKEDLEDKLRRGEPYCIRFKVRCCLAASGKTSFSIFFPFMSLLCMNEKKEKNKSYIFPTFQRVGGSEAEKEIERSLFYEARLNL